MEWLNLHTSILDSPEMIGAEPIDRATWLFLLRYCIGQENSGIIEGCENWGDRRWQQMVRVTLSEVTRQTDLWRFVGGNLEVNFFPLAKQKEIEAKRDAGKRTAARRWGKQCSSLNSSAIRSAHREGEGEGEGEGEAPSQPSAGCVDTANIPLLVEHWNRKSRLPAIRQLSAARRKALAARLKDPFFADNWTTAIDRLDASDFATGNTDGSWVANIDWFLKPDSVLKITEGKYDNKRNNGRDPALKEV